MHTHSWFTVNGSSEHLIVGKGGRQGCRFGGVLFNLSYAKALKTLYQRASEEGIVLMIRHRPGAAPGAETSEEIPSEDVPVFDVTFVDDEAIVITAAVPSTLSRKFSRAVQLLIEVFDHYGMTVNWKPGKTEAIIVYRGKKAKDEAAKLVGQDGARTFVIPKECQGVDEQSWIRVNVVAQYKHLGSTINGSGNLVPEARQRVKSSMHAFAPLAKRMLGSKSVGLKRRVTIGWTLVISRLTFNVHVWSKFAGKPRAILNSLYMRVWRRIIGDPKFRKTRWSDQQVRMVLDVPSLDCYIRKRRLKYLARLTQAQFDSLHAVLQSKGNLGENMPWVDLLINDLKILRHSSNGKLSELPDPTESLVPYWTLARNYPGEWKAIVELYKTHNDDVDNSKQVVFGQNQGSQLNANSFCCGVCGKSWDSWRKLSVHKWSKHGMRSDIRQFVGDVCVCVLFVAQTSSREPGLSNVYWRGVFDRRSEESPVNKRSLTPILH